MNENDFEYRFVQTCGACPEQYDVYKNDIQVAYVRLRGGHLRVDVPDVGGRTIYDYKFDDSMQGCFDDEDQRNLFLAKIVRELDKIVQITS